MMNDLRPHDPMQIIFDGAEAAQDALHCQAGCEAALLLALEQIFARDPDGEAIVQALIESMALWRAQAEAKVRQMQAVSMGRVQ